MSVVGNSFGGGIAMHLAIESSRVSRLILNSSIGIPLRISKMRLIGYVLKINLASLLIGRKRLDLEMLGQYRGNFEIRKRWNWLRHVVLKCVNDDYSLMIKKVNKSTLLLWGEGR